MAIVEPPGIRALMCPSCPSWRVYTRIPKIEKALPIQSIFGIIIHVSSSLNPNRLSPVSGTSKGLKDERKNITASAPIEIRTIILSPLVKKRMSPTASPSKKTFSALGRCGTS